MATDNAPQRAGQRALRRGSHFSLHPRVHTRRPDEMGIINIHPFRSSMVYLTRRKDRSGADNVCIYIYIFAIRWTLREGRERREGNLIGGGGRREKAGKGQEIPRNRDVWTEDGSSTVSVSVTVAPLSDRRKEGRREREKFVAPCYLIR